MIRSQTVTQDPLPETTENVSTSSCHAVIEANADRYLKDLAGFIRIPSVSTENQGIEEAVHWLTKKMQSLGVDSIQVHKTARHPIITSQINTSTTPSAPRLLVYGHYDVQPTGSLEEWRHDPFKAVWEEDRLYGRGTCDMKNNLVALLLALDVLRTQDQMKRLNLVFCFEGEEEIGSPSFQPFLQSHSDVIAADAILVAEGGETKMGQNSVIRGYKGLLGLELIARSPANEEVHSSFAGVVTNPAWRLVQALASLRDPYGKILVPGFAARGGWTSFTDRLKYQLAGLVMTREQLESSLGVSLPPDMSVGQALRTLFFEPTLNINGIEGGYPILGGIKTVVPATSHARLDARLIPGQDPDRLFEHVKHRLVHQGFGDLEVRKVAALPPYTAPLRDPFLGLVEQAQQTVFGDTLLRAPIAPASGAFTWLPQHLNAPMASAGSGLVYLAHRPNEYIPRHLFLKGIQLYAEIFSRFAEPQAPYRSA